MEGFEGDPYASCTPRQSEYSLFSLSFIIITQISISNRDIQIENEYKYEFNHLLYLKIASPYALFIPFKLSYTYLSIYLFECEIALNCFEKSSWFLVLVIYIFTIQ